MHVVHYTAETQQGLVKFAGQFESKDAFARFVKREVEGPRKWVWAMATKVIPAWGDVKPTPWDALEASYD